MSQKLTQTTSRSSEAGDELTDFEFSQMFDEYNHDIGIACCPDCDGLLKLSYAATLQPGSSLWNLFDCQSCGSGFKYHEINGSTYRRTEPNPNGVKII